MWKLAEEGEGVVEDEDDEGRLERDFEPGAEEPRFILLLVAPSPVLERSSASMAVTSESLTPSALRARAAG
jgi:hypothetical protein